MTTTPQIIVSDRGGFYQIYRSTPGQPIEWWSRRRSWLEAKRENVRYYSRFKTKGYAENDAAMLRGWMHKPIGQ